MKKDLRIKNVNVKKLRYFEAFTYSSNFRGEILEPLLTQVCQGESKKVDINLISHDRNFKPRFMKFGSMTVSTQGIQISSQNFAIFLKDCS